MTYKKEGLILFKDVNYIYEDGISKDSTKHYEGLFTQGSGYLHIRGSYEEGIMAAPQNEEYMRMPANVTIEKPRHPRSKFGTYIPGITGRHPLLNEEMVNLPYPFLISVYVDGEQFDVDESNVIKHERILDMRDGVLHRNFVWITKSGVEVKANYKRFISRKNPNIAFWKGEITTDKQCCLRIVDDIYTDVKTNGYNHFVHIDKTAQKCHLVTDNNDSVDISTKICCDKLCFECVDEKMEAAGVVAADACITMTKLCCFHTSRDAGNNAIKYASAEEYLAENLLSYEKEYKESFDIWDRLWLNSRIVITGDDYAQYAVNFSIYHLLRSINMHDSRVAICAKGFAGEAYFGHFFWDTEIYLLPFYLYTNPDMAKKLVEFRINTLSGAIRNAKSYGYEGARYPWESSVLGDEQCPNWQYADNEVHITADVVFGLWHYYTNTQDIEFLRNIMPVLTETSKYWCSRVYKNQDSSVHINGVMGPDEYICFCNDNSYTNYMVKYALYITLKANDILKKQGDEKLLSKEEYDKIKNIADNIYIEKESDGLYWQCKDFESFEDIDFSAIWKNRNKMFGSIISQEINYRSKALKQADVLMLPYLFNDLMSEEQLQLNFSYYYPITTHDSSLSYVVHSILLSKLGKTEEAYKLFKKSANIDLDLDKKGAAEGIHIANCGGIWQSIILGFAGICPSYEKDTLTLNPKLPPNWESLSFSINFKGELYSVNIYKDRYNVEKIYRR